MFLYFTITQNCNLECPHCCYDAGLNRPSMTIKDIEKVIYNFPYKTQTIVLTGGEVFTRKKILYSTLELIKKRRFMGLEDVCVQTNGSWAKNVEQANKVLDELVKLGVTWVAVASNDAYHRKAGLDMERVRLLNNLLEKRKIFNSEGAEHYNPNLKVFPVGKAISLPRKYWEYRDRSMDRSATCTRFNEYASIDHKGNLYPCCWMVPGTELGDARKEKVMKIIKRASKNEKLLTLVGKNGPKKLAKEHGLDKREIEEQLEYGLCGLCAYLFEEKGLKLI